MLILTFDLTKLSHFTSWLVNYDSLFCLIIIEKHQSHWEQAQCPPPRFASNERWSLRSGSASPNNGKMHLLGQNVDGCWLIWRRNSTFSSSWDTLVVIIWLLGERKNDKPRPCVSEEDANHQKLTPTCWSTNEIKHHFSLSTQNISPDAFLCVRQWHWRRTLVDVSGSVLELWSHLTVAALWFRI